MSFQTVSRSFNGETQLGHLDTKLGIVWDPTEAGENNWNACHSPGFTGPGFLRQVYAVASRNGPFHKGKPDAIQLCAHYLRWQYPQKFKLSSSVEPAWIEVVVPEAQVILDSAQKTPMDLRTGELLDRILAHELTHLTKAGLSADYPPNFYGPNGWNYSVQYSNVGDKNAENLAMLGFAATLI
ncbi:hypothetical protein IMSHALPRED_002094 [Imshaugia aleurites]|uniref:Uncharacterized protein n=1 Tax=Imshaugia aleurites TaxID=172621 RepID=A0A8H3J4I8_9LECA|nr:hypothetical protein IMSHALPRED_002094 [Imshaugia aleurites]